MPRNRALPRFYKIHERPHWNCLTFRTLTSPPLPSRLHRPPQPTFRPLNINHFEAYLRQYAPLHAAYNRDVHPESSTIATPHATQNTAPFLSRQSTGTSIASDHSDKQQSNIPSYFFDPNFDIAAHIELPKFSSSSDPLPEASTKVSANITTLTSPAPSQHSHVDALRRELSGYKHTLQAQLTLSLIHI